jgi:hypothetical protein
MESAADRFRRDLDRLAARYDFYREHYADSYDRLANLVYDILTGADQQYRGTDDHNAHSDTDHSRSPGDPSDDPSGDHCDDSDRNRREHNR